jgi:hypothetical protein
MNSMGYRSKIALMRVTGCLTTMALLYVLGLWPSVAFGQQLPGKSSVQGQAELTKSPNPARTAQPLLLGSPAPNLIPSSAPPANDPASALTSALASCDKADGVEPVPLPGAKGEIKLDRCYRGRERLVCSFRALLSEAKSLLSYRKTVDANYPELGSVDEVCKIRPDTLVTELEDASHFAFRFKALKAEYDARVNCANTVEQSLRDVTLPDMTQAPAMLKSMIDAIEGDIRGISVAQAELVEFAERMNSSQKALLTIQKIHQTMCGKSLVAKLDAQKVGISASTSLDPTTVGALPTTIPIKEAPKGPNTVADCEKASMKWDGKTARCVKVN